MKTSMNLIPINICACLSADRINVIFGSKLLNFYRLFPRGIYTEMPQSNTQQNIFPLKARYWIHTNIIMPQMLKTKQQFDNFGPQICAIFSPFLCLFPLWFYIFQFRKWLPLNCICGLIYWTGTMNINL